MDVIANLGGFANVTAGTLLAITVFMILAGKLVPRSHLDAIRVEKDAWQAAATASEKARVDTETASWKAIHALTLVERVLSSLIPPGKEGGSANVPVTLPEQEDA